VVLLEFTIEPFVEGRPGRHVTEAIAAVEGLGAEVDVGPFGTTCRVAVGAAAEMAKAVVAAALANGATHVSLYIEREGG
jgi:uncharacterized protein YqgV (UPF0045/DUF77 family)